jgi:glycosyltransferase involved in cell wall biosynthesis
MRVVVVTKIFPSSLEPLSSPFARQQIAELSRQCDVEVLAAVPSFPLARWTGIPPRAARLSALPKGDRIDGIRTTYVRQLYVPKVGLSAAVPLYLASLWPHRRRIRDADVVFATWAYPDGCAAVLAARALGKPCVVKVHGSDVNVVLKRRTPRWVAGRVLPMAHAAVAVSNPLAEELTGLGIAPFRVAVVPNGVDRTVFFPRDRDAERASLGIPRDAHVVLFVGRVERQKGVVELLAAFDRIRTQMSAAMLVMIGEATPMDEAVACVRRWGSAAVRILGSRPHAEVARWMGASDVLALPSWAEGTPNVVLESLASGRPVVATNVGGIPDLLSSDDAGILVPPRDAPALASALENALRAPWDARRVAARAPWSWSASAAALKDVFVAAAAAAKRRAPVSAMIDAS